jgi:hypothetical protein
LLDSPPTASVAAVAPLILQTSVHIGGKLARHLLELGLGLGVIGSLILVWGSIYILRAMRREAGAQRHQRNWEKLSLLVGFVFVLVGIGLEAVANLTRIFA